MRQNESTLPARNEGIFGGVSGKLLRGGAAFLIGAAAFEVSNVVVRLTQDIALLDEADQVQGRLEKSTPAESRARVNGEIQQCLDAHVACDVAVRGGLGNNVPVVDRVVNGLRSPGHYVECAATRVDCLNAIK